MSMSVVVVVLFKLFTCWFLPVEFVFILVYSLGIVGQQPKKKNLVHWIHTYKAHVLAVLASSANE